MQQAIPVPSATHSIEDRAKLSYIGIKSFKRESFGTPANRGILVRDIWTIGNMDNCSAVKIFQSKQCDTSSGLAEKIDLALGSEAKKVSNSTRKNDFCFEFDDF